MLDSRDLLLLKLSEIELIITYNHIMRVFSFHIIEYWSNDDCKNFTSFAAPGYLR